MFLVHYSSSQFDKHVWIDNKEPALLTAYHLYFLLSRVFLRGFGEKFENFATRQRKIARNLTESP